MSVIAARTPIPTGAWSVDRATSRVGFKVRQFGVAAVRGAFHEFEGTLELGDDLAGASAHGSVSAASLDTENRRRDDHLRSRDFLDADRYPTLSFTSRAIRPLGAETLEITGDLTLHGVTRPITLTAEVQDREDARVAFTVRGRLDRGDYDVTPSRLLDMLIAERVELELEISALRAG